MIRRPTPETLTLDGENYSVCLVAHFDPDYRRAPKTEHFCCLCQRDIARPKDETPYLHYVDGGNAVLSQADEERYQAASAKQPGGQFAGEMGCYPVGPECAKRAPKGFVIPPKVWPST